MTYETLCKLALNVGNLNGLKVDVIYKFCRVNESSKVKSSLQSK